MEDVKVTFSFISCQERILCEYNHSITEENAQQATCDDVPSCVFLCSVVKVYDFEKRRAGTFMISCDTGTTVQKVFDALTSSDSSLVSGRSLVCYAPSFDSVTDDFFPCSPGLLKPLDLLPSVAFLQTVESQVEGSRTDLQRILTNIVICSSDSTVSVGHVPFVVEFPLGGHTKHGICASIARLHRMCRESLDFLKTCPLVSCSVGGNQITLGGPADTGECLDQLALVYPLLNVGDVVIVDLQQQFLSSNRPSSVVQGIIVRRFMECGIVLYAVKETDTSVVVEELTCLQLVPL